MLYFKDVPVVIEIGTAALEVAVVEKKDGAERLFYAHFERVKLNQKTAAELPFVVSSSAPHVFTMSQNLKKSPYLLVYDYLGKLSTVYVKEAKTNSWLKSDTAPEQVGDTVTLFSVRFSFDSTELRDNFMSLLKDISANYKVNNKISRKSVAALLDILDESKSPGPVVLPVAVSKNTVV